MAPPKTRLTRASGAAGSSALLVAHDIFAPGNNNNGNGLMASKKATKRKADASPQRNDKVKRSALGNLTNAVANNANNVVNAGGKENLTLKTAAAVSVLMNQVKQQQHMVMRKRDCTDGVNGDNANAENVENICANSGVTSYGKLAAQQQQQYLAAPRPTKVLTRAAARATLPGETTTTVKPVVAAANNKKPLSNGAAVAALPTVPAAAAPEMQYIDVPKPQPRRRISNEFERTKDQSSPQPDTDDNSLYMSALESCESDRQMSLLSRSWTASMEATRIRRKTTGREGILNLNNMSSTEVSQTLKEDAQLMATTLPPHDTHDWIAQSTVPANVVDFDRENWDDPFQASHYAMDIFNYLKSREPLFVVDNYMERQKHINRWMRSLLVDWMVEVQETFELNHETLYLAVKVVDLYLARVIVIKDKLQLLGAAAMFLACKYDERTPPLIDDFLYICDGAYVQKELIAMEMDVFRTIGYDLGMPLSYRFLRRYARVSLRLQFSIFKDRFICF